MKLKHVIYYILFVLLFSCKKDPSNSTATNPVSPTEIKYDSVNLVRMISHSSGAMINFYYDTLNNRLDRYQIPYGSHYAPDFLYDNAGRIKTLVYGIVPENNFQGFVTILNYSSDGRLMKVFHKTPLDAGEFAFHPNYKTDTTTKILAYDSLVYNSKKQLIASYHIYLHTTSPNRIQSMYSFTYHLYNDSLVHNIKYFEARDSWNYELRLLDSVSFESYDNRPNPFYRDFKYSAFFSTGLYTYKLSYALQIPMRFRQFLTLSPQNCTKMKVSLYSSIYENYSIRYTYLPPDSRVDSFIINYNGSTWGSFGGVVRYTKQRVRK